MKTCNQIGIGDIRTTEETSSPIIMSYRSGDQSPELVVMAHTIKEIYSDLGYPIPDGIQTLAGTGPAFT